MGEGEGRDEGREKESEDDKDDSEDDHDVYLVSMQMDGRDKRGSDLVAADVGVVSRAGGSVFEGVFDLGSCLFGVALELIGAALGAQPGVAGGAADNLLDGALDGFGLVGDLLTDAHSRIPSFSGDRG